jgi:hypothetical protein
MMTSTARELQPVVLIVGDEARVGLFPVDVFAEAGMRVVQAATAAAALEILENRSDVLFLFTDLTSPEEADGLELAGIVSQPSSPRAFIGWLGVRCQVREIGCGVEGTRRAVLGLLPPCEARLMGLCAGEHSDI